MKHIEGQGIRHRKQEEDRKQQALKVQQELLAKQAAEKAKLNATERVKPDAVPIPPIRPPPQLLKPQGPPVAGPPAAGPPVAGPPAAGPPVAGPPVLPSVKPAVTVPNQAAQLAEERTKKRETMRQDLEVAGPQGVAKLSDNLKQAGMSKALVDNIIDRIQRGELSYTNIRDTLRNGGLKGVTDYIAPPATSGPRRSVRFKTGGTRKHITSLRNMTRRLGRQ